MDTISKNSPKNHTSKPYLPPYPSLIKLTFISRIKAGTSISYYGITLGLLIDSIHVLLEIPNHTPYIFTIIISLITLSISGALIVEKAYLIIASHLKSWSYFNSKLKRTMYMSVIMDKSKPPILYPIVKIDSYGPYILFQVGSKSKNKICKFFLMNINHILNHPNPADGMPKEYFSVYPLNEMPDLKKMNQSVFDPDKALLGLSTFKKPTWINNHTPSNF